MCPWGDSTRADVALTTRARAILVRSHAVQGETVIRFAHISLGEGGGPACHRCARPVPATRFRAGDDVRAEIREVAADWEVPGGPNVLFDGFEPFAHPELPALIEAARSSGYRRIGLETDGGALAQAGNAAGSLHAGVRHLRIRTLGLDEAGDELAGRPGLAFLVTSGVRLFREAAEAAGVPVAVSAAVPVCAHNADALPAIVAALARAGVGAVRLEGAGQGGVRLADRVAAACDTGTVNRVWVEASGLPLPDTHASHARGDER